MKFRQHVTPLTHEKLVMFVGSRQLKNDALIIFSIHLTVVPTLALLYCKQLQSKHISSCEWQIII